MSSRGTQAGDTGRCKELATLGRGHTAGERQADVVA